MVEDGDENTTGDGTDMNTRPPTITTTAATPTTLEIKGEREVGFIKKVMGLIRDPGHEKPAKRLIWGIMDVLQSSGDDPRLPP